jgi:glycine cleavage system H protein
MFFPEDLKYTKDHEWIRIEGNIGTIGITDHAQSELGDVVFVDIPSDLGEVTCGKAFGTIEAVKTVADVYAPVSGKVVEINSAVNDNPEVVNKDPYGEGWLIKVEITNPDELNSLLDVNAYKQLIGQ